MLTIARKAEGVINGIGLKKLSLTEEKYMEVIWAHPEGISSEDIYNVFDHSTGTKGSILFKISQKGYVNSIQRGRHHIYTARISQAEYNQALSKNKMCKILGNTNISLESLIASFTGKVLNEEQIDKVKKFLEDLENDMGDN